MDKNTIAESLRALATNDKKRSETARLRDVIDDVEIALKAGVSRTTILETLHEQGFSMTPKSFESAIYRLRKKRLLNKTTTAPSALIPIITTPESVQPILKEKTEQKQNPLRALSGTPKDENYIPKAKFELD